MSEVWHWEHLGLCIFLVQVFLTSKIMFIMQLLSKQIWYAKDITFPPKRVGFWGPFKAAVWTNF